jgi:hypothetical protein
LVKTAEEQANKTCEECDAPGLAERNNRGWVKVLCTQCHDKQTAPPERQFSAKERIFMLERKNK